MHDHSTAEVISAAGFAPLREEGVLGVQNWGLEHRPLPRVISEGGRWSQSRADTVELNSPKEGKGKYSSRAVTHSAGC